AQVDVLTPNESEFASLLGPGADVDADAVAGMDDAALHALCRRLLPHGTVVVTLGAAGAFVSHGDAALHGDAEACYRVPAGDAAVVDTTGAGDAFNGALAGGLSRDPGRFGEGVRFAARFAALSTERKGAASAMPTLDEVEERYRELLMRTIRIIMAWFSSPGVFSMPRFSLLAAAILGGFSVLPAHAQDHVTDFDKVTVSASTSRLPDSEAALPNTITVITAEQLQEQLAVTRDLSQVLANLIPAFAPSRQKMSSFGESLRGR